MSGYQIMSVSFYKGVGGRGDHFLHKGIYRRATEFGRLFMIVIL